MMLVRVAGDAGGSLSWTNPSGPVIMGLSYDRVAIFSERVRGTEGQR